LSKMRASARESLMRDRLARHDDRAARQLLRWLVAVALAAVSLAAVAATPIDTIVVRLRDDTASAGGATLATDDRNALISSLRSTFSLVDRAREGAYVLQFTTPLALDAACAAVNRARLLPQVLYANFEDPGGTAADPAFAQETLARHPAMTRMIVKYGDAALVVGRPAVESSPGDCNGVITVGATGRLGQRVVQQLWPASGTFGTRRRRRCNGVIDDQFRHHLADTRRLRYTGYQGTSMATPHVVGIAFLMLSVNPSLTPAQVASLLSSANPATAGSTVTFTATVIGSSPTGTVAFADAGGDRELQQRQPRGLGQHEERHLYDQHPRSQCLQHNRQLQRRRQQYPSGSSVLSQSHD